MENTTPNICRICGGAGIPSNGIVNYHDIQTSDTRKEFLTNMEDCLKCEKCGHSWVPPLSLIDGIPLVPFRVKITRCCSEGAWYRRRVGEEFSVGPHPEESDLYVVWEDIIDKTSKFLRGILIKDCEVIIPMENIAKPYEPKERTPKTAEESNTPFDFIWLAIIHEHPECCTTMQNGGLPAVASKHSDKIALIFDIAAKNYARTVALQVRAECAEKAKVTTIPKRDKLWCELDRESILSINVEQFIR